MLIDDLNEAGKLPLKWSLRAAEIAAEMLTRYWGLAFLGCVVLFCLCYLLQWAIAK